MKLKIIVILFAFVNCLVNAQKMDVDSLLVVAYKEVNQNKNYPKAIQLAHIGIKKAPNYLDFYIVLGRTYMITKEVDSSRYYFNYVLDRNSSYVEGFTYLAQLEIEQNNSKNALIVIDKALYYYPRNIDFTTLKLEALQLKRRIKKTTSNLAFTSESQKVNDTLKPKFLSPIIAFSSDRIGLSYNNTFFDRKEIGPWHLVGLQYIRERKKITTIAGINYAKRHNFDTNTSGLEYEFSSYIKMFPKNYSFASISFSSDALVFPKLRLSYSYNQNFNKGWEAEAGIRYTKTEIPEFYTGVLGIGKYIGSYWFNLKTYLLFFENKMYPALTAISRYYFNTRYDYVSATIGYGSTPDERITLNQFQERFIFNSYRFGLGYNKIIYTNYIVGLQFNYNKQEYQTTKYQSEYNMLLSLQYKF